MSEPAPSVPPADFSDLMGPELASALAKKGYHTLTPVQLSVLDPEVVGRDLRISSQTGSGKTLAIGFALRQALSLETLSKAPVARPQALVIVPTRELAHQVYDELSWLYAPMKLRVASVAGGASYRDEHRMLSSRPAIVVGTPGRLLDHLKRGGIEAEDVAAVVLDEADRMLDLGFRDELEAILDETPPGRRTHLVSATFARDVAALADRVQANPRRIEGTPLGSANRDIDHIIYLVRPNERVDALINVLLHHADEQTLVFARTRADVSEISRQLQQAGFASGSLSGEMDQNARNRALSAFKRGDIRALIATDVAARGIDVQDIGRVIQMDPPTDPDTYTHRSGRTGRAGRKGVSAVLVGPAGLKRASSLLMRAKVKFRIEAIPTAEAIRTTQDEHWLAELTAGDEREVPERVQKQVQRILDNGLTERALAQLIVSVRRATGEPRDITPLSADNSAPRQFGRDSHDSRDRRPPPRQFEQRGDRRDSARPSDRPSWNPPPPRSAGPGSDRPDGPPPRRDSNESFVPFRVSWGEAHGADARRLVAMLCRRGNIRGSDIGAIRVSRMASTVEVAASVAQSFAEATREPDPRDPRVLVTPFSDGPPPSDVQGDDGPRPPREFNDGPRAPREFNDGPRAPREFNDGPRPPRAFKGADGPRPPRSFNDGPRAPREFKGADGPRPPREFKGADGPRPPREFKGADGPRPPREFKGADGPRAPRTFNDGPRAPRTFNDGPRAPRAFKGADGPRPPRDFKRPAGPPARDMKRPAPAPRAERAPAAAPIRDEAPKRPSRKIVVTAPPRRVPKRK